MSSIGVDDVVIGIRSRAATGKKFESGQPFNDRSDLDFFLISDKLYQQAVDKGAFHKNGMGKVGATKIFFPDIHAIDALLSQKLERKVTVRIDSQSGFESVKEGSGVFH